MQDCPQEVYPSKLEMHLLVKNVDNWHKHIQDKNISKKYEVVVSNLQIQPWRMKEFLLSDPSGAIWRIAQNI